jgi:hypothetical protein
MSSHHEWVSDVVEQHDAEKPFAPENGRPLAFKPGDAVIYTNDQGATFARTVAGYYRPEQPCSLYARGYRYLLNGSSPWMPVREASLQPAG